MSETLNGAITISWLQSPVRITCSQLVQQVGLSVTTVARFAKARRRMFSAAPHKPEGTRLQVPKTQRLDRTEWGDCALGTDMAKRLRLATM